MDRKREIYSGVIQVHSDRCGGMSLERSLDAAREYGVNYIIFTERNGDQNAHKMAGWYGDVLVLVAEEVRFAEGEYLALNCPDWVQCEKELEASMDKVNEQSGMICSTFAALSENGHQQPSIPSPINVERADMITAWSFLDEFVTRVSGDQALLFQQRPERVIYGPERKSLRRWDQELGKRSVPAIGCVNAVMRKDPLLQWKEFFTFRTSFRTIHTSILLDKKLSEDSQEATKQVWQALHEGRSVIYNYSIDSIQNFEFKWIDPVGQQTGIGESETWKTGGKIFVSIPKAAEIVIRANGDPIFWGTGKTIEFPAAVPGTYRVEVYLDRRLWILTNPINLRDPGDFDLTDDVLNDFI